MYLFVTSPFPLRVICILLNIQKLKKIYKIRHLLQNMQRRKMTVALF